MNSKLTKSAFAIGLLAGVAFLPTPSYALDDDADVDVEAPGASVEIEGDRPGILPRLRGDDPDVDVYVEDEDDDDVPPGASVEIDPD
jgi:hypothetical protein